MHKLKEQNSQTSFVAYLLLFVVVVALGTGIFLQKCTLKRMEGVAISVEQAKVSKLYVLRGPAMVKDDILSVEPNLVEWFTNRPERKAGQMTAENLSSIWDKAFKDSAPNAVIVGDEVDAVVKLVSAVSVDRSIDFEYQVIEGQLKNGKLGEVSIFIDPDTVAPELAIFSRTG